jgi:hypothetical protein
LLLLLFFVVRPVPSRPVPSRRASPILMLVLMLILMLVLMTVLMLVLMFTVNVSHDNKD